MHARSLRRARFVSVAASVAVVAAMSGYVASAANAASSVGPGDPNWDKATAAGVPHYYGPWPNWATSQWTTPTATVDIAGVADANGVVSGADAAAVANVNPDGAVTSIDVTSPGHDYVNGAAVTVGGGGTGATAHAVVTTSGGVVSAKPTVAGGGYSGFAVTVSGGGGTGAALTATGGVDQVTVTDAGGGYTFPTVDFDLPDDPNGTQAEGHAVLGAKGSIASVVVDTPGSGYSQAPGVTISNGTTFDPAALDTNVDPTAHLAVAAATLSLTGLTVDAPGDGYTSTPDILVSDLTGGTGTGATAAATVDVGVIAGIVVDNAGSGYLNVGIHKFQDDLPLPCTPGVDCDKTTNLGKNIPLGVPESKDYNGVTADEYVIGLVQYRTPFNSDLKGATGHGSLVRGYVQIEPAEHAPTLADGTPNPNAWTWSAHYPLTNELLNGTTVPITDAAGNQVYGVTAPQWLGPTLVTTKDKPVRIVFHNYLPTGKEGNLFVPVDSTLMGSGSTPTSGMAPTNDGTVYDQVRNPNCTTNPNGDCYTQNRADLHLHGGTTPWISDGTPHQWITPAGDYSIDANGNKVPTQYPQGVSVKDVPDMNACPRLPDGSDDPRDGCQTYYYTNEQSARLLFYHDHAWGITRLNVYVGEAAGYLIGDDTETKLVHDGTIPTIEYPLVVQDRTFVPDATQLEQTDPTWDKSKWGDTGDLWFHHVYMPAQNPSDPTGMSTVGRWMYGPWFWPPASNTVYGPIDNPYYDPKCNIDDPNTWQYQTDPYCEPQQIPGTPNLSTGMEQFNDTPTVNGVAYPKLTVDPQSYRFRMLNAANDRFFNFQWYIADPTNLGPGGNPTEVKLDPALVAAAQTDPNVYPTPLHSFVDGSGTTVNLDGPDWIQIGNEAGFLPAPTIVDGQQPITWITDPTRFDFGNADKHSLLIAPAERADVIVDFSKFAGKTLILYNDAPAAFPARQASYDYYTGQPDMQPNGSPAILPGFGPNTRTIMQVTVKDTTPAAAFDYKKLQKAFLHKADKSGVFESGQHPIIVGQAAYNSAYGTKFVKSGNCVAQTAGALAKCDGFVRINDTASFNFNTLADQTHVMNMDLQPKAIHDEMNSTSFDEYGRMQATLGVEAQPPAPGMQNVTLYPYVNPGTEFIDGTALPPAANLQVTGVDANGNATYAISDIKIKPIKVNTDGTQIWQITHNGVDTHPVHFHLFDVQLLNRTTWDNIIIPTEANELGWKDTIRVSPLEDTYVALRPVIPTVPFEVPNAVRPLNPADPIGSTALFNNVDPAGNPTNAISNQLVNFGWEYVYHCHILTHEEMDMMRPVTLAMPPLKAEITSVTPATNGNNTVVFNDNSITETAFVLERTTDNKAWTPVGKPMVSPLDQKNTHRTGLTFVDTTSARNRLYGYRIKAENTVGYGAEFPSMTVQSYSATGYNGTVPTATTVTAAAGTGGVRVSWTGGTGATSFVVQRSVDGGTFTQVATPTASPWTDTAVVPGSTYVYKVAGVNIVGTGSFGTSAPYTVPVPPGAFSVGSATATRVGPTTSTQERLTVSWAAASGATSYQVQWSLSSTTWVTAGTANWTPGTALTLTTGTIVRTAWYVRVAATNAGGTTYSSNVVAVPRAA